MSGHDCNPRMRWFASSWALLASILPEAGTFTSNVLVLSGGSIAAQAINAASVLILARLFTPGELGSFALFTAVSLFILPLTSLRYETAIMLPEEDSEAVTLLGISFLLLIITCAVSVLVWVGGRDHIVRFISIRQDEAAMMTVCGPLNLFAWGAFQILSYWCSRVKAFPLIALGRLVSVVGVLACQVALYWVG